MRKTTKKILIALVSILLTVFVIFSALVVYAWFTNMPRVYTSDQDSGNIARIGMRINLLFERLRSEGFPNGTTITYADGKTATFDKDAVWGTAENPYIISMSRHMINLYALQRAGYFHDRYVSHYGEEGYDDDECMPYFLICDPEDGSPITVDGNRNGTNIQIQPIGNDQYPFIGCIGGGQVENATTSVGGKTSLSSAIANFDVVAKQGDVDVGLFGKIGYLGTESGNEGDTFEGAISYVSNLLLYDVKIVSKNTSIIEQIADHLFANEVSGNIRYEEDHHIGILAGHIEYASITNISVYYSSDDILALDVDDSGANYLSDCGFIGLVYNLNPEVNGNAIGSASGTTIAGAVAGVGNEWGASIDMKTIFNRLQNTLTEAKRYSDQTYVSAETVIIDEVQGGDPVVTPTSYGTYTTFPTDSDARMEYYYSLDGGSYVFADFSGSTSVYDLMHGKSATYYPKTVTTITKKNEFKDAWYIHDGSNYLSVTGTALSTANSEQAAAKWLLDESGHLYTNIETETAIVKYYLNRTNAGALGVSTTASTVWHYSGSGDEFDSLLYTTVSGTNYYVQYNNGWSLTPIGTYYYLSDGSGHYLSGTTSGVTNVNTEANSVRWALSNPNGSTTTISSYINGTTYYLRGDGALTMSGTAFTWNRDDDVFYTTIQGVRYNLVYNNGWRVVPASGKKITDGSGHWLTATASAPGNASEAEAVVWQFSSESGNTQIYTVLNGQKYYLTANNNALTVSTAAATWTRSGNSFYMSSGGKDYYLSYDGGWIVTTLTYFTIDDGSGNYLRVNGANDFANGSSDNATHFYFATEAGANSRGKAYCIVGGNIYYLCNNSGILETSDEANGTQWLNDGNSLYVESGSTTYALQYDSGWKIKNLTAGYYITDGTQYITVSGTTIGSTENVAEATIFTFSNTGNNPSGTIQVPGTNYYLRNNNGTLQVSTTSTNWSNDGTRLYTGNNNNRRNLGYYDGGWAMTTSNSTSVTVSLGYTISLNGNYLCVDENGNVINRTNPANPTLWSGNSGEIYTTVNGTRYYLYQNDTALTTSTGSGTNWTKNGNGSNGALYTTTTSGGWFSSTTYHYIDFSNGWIISEATQSFWGGTPTLATLTMSEVTETINIVSRVVANDTTRPTVKVEAHTNAAPQLTVNSYTAMGTDVSIDGPSNEDLTFTKTSEQTITKSVTTEAGGHDTYFPLIADDTAPFAVNQKNTGYVVGGSHASYQQSSGDVRVASYYTFGDSRLQNSLSNNAYTSYRRDRLEVVTKTYLSNGYVRILDNYNGSNTPRTALTNKFGTTRYSDESLGLKKYDGARDQLHEMFVPSGNANTTYNGAIYGMHFMDAVISIDNLVTADKVVINEQTYYNYQMPEDCIDFRLRTKGYINFFAGTYYLNTGYTNNCFFSLNQIFRNSNDEITAIKRISKIYGVPDNDKKQYIYLYGDGTYSSGNSSPVGHDGYVEMFDTDWIERPDKSSLNGYLERTLYYFEIPVNAGEYALGSVETQQGESARYGAYLCYLDIGTSAATHSSVIGTIDYVYDNSELGGSKIVVVPDTSDNDTSFNYYHPSLAVMYTKNSDDNNEVRIDVFTVTVERTVGSGDAAATLTTTFGGSDNSHLEVVAQHSGGDTLVNSP